MGRGARETFQRTGSGAHLSVAESLYLDKIERECWEFASYAGKPVVGIERLRRW